MSRNEVLILLRQFHHDCAAKYGIRQMGLFGSVARDTAGESSDVDIWVETRTPDPYALVHIKSELQRRLGRRVDLVRMRSQMNPQLKARIAREGVHV